MAFTTVGRRDTRLMGPTFGRAGLSLRDTLALIATQRLVIRLDKVLMYRILGARHIDSVIGALVTSILKTVDGSRGEKRAGVE